MAIRSGRILFLAFWERFSLVVIHGDIYDCTPAIMSSTVILFLLIIFAMMISVNSTLTRRTCRPWLTHPYFHFLKRLPTTPVFSRVWQPIRLVSSRNPCLTFNNPCFCTTLASHTLVITLSWHPTLLSSHCPDTLYHCLHTGLTPHNTCTYSNPSGWLLYYNSFTLGILDGLINTPPYLTLSHLQYILQSIWYTR